MATTTPLLIDASTVDGSTSERTASGSIDWASVARWTAIGVLALAMAVLLSVSRDGGNNPVSLIQPGTQGAATHLIARDFPEIAQPDGHGLDGQMYYAIARDPIHLDETAANLDGPRYRLQRPLLSWAAWALHPTGGGRPLVIALSAVVLLGMVIGGLATGALSQTLGGPAWLAALFPVLPGAYWSLRVTVSDALALGLALAAITLAARSRHAAAVAVAVLAVLAKEPVLLIFLGWALHRRTRRDAAVLVVPALVMVGWMGWLHVQLPEGASQSRDLGLPLKGLVDAWRLQWSRGQEYVGMACTLGGLAIGFLALGLRRLRHPLGWAIAVQLGFLLVMQVNPTAMNFGGTRMAMPVMVLGAVALLTPQAAALRSGLGTETHPSRGSQAVPDPATGPAAP